MDATCLTRREKRCITLNNLKFRDYGPLKKKDVFTIGVLTKFCNASVIASNNSEKIVDQSKSLKPNIFKPASL